MFALKSRHVSVCAYVVDADNYNAIRIGFDIDTEQRLN